MFRTLQFACSCVLGLFGACAHKAKLHHTNVSNLCRVGFELIEKSLKEDGTPVRRVLNRAVLLIQAGLRMFFMLLVGLT